MSVISKQRRGQGEKGKHVAKKILPFLLKPVFRSNKNAFSDRKLPSAEVTPTGKDCTITKRFVVILFLIEHHMSSSH